MGLIRYLLIAAVAMLAIVIFKRVVARPLRQHLDDKEDERLGRLVQDPQCLVYVDNRDAVRRKVPGGELFFCSESCAKQYMEAQGGG